MESTDKNKKEFLIESCKATQGAILKYKENESNKILQIFHATTAIIVALIAIFKDNYIAISCLILALFFIFVSYTCFYFSDFHFATVNVYTLLEAYAHSYEVEGLDAKSQLEKRQRLSKAKRYRKGYLYSILFVFLFIILSLVLYIIH